MMDRREFDQDEPVKIRRLTHVDFLIDSHAGKGSSERAIVTS